MGNKQSLADTVKEILDTQHDKYSDDEEYQRFLKLSQELDALFGKRAEDEMASPMQVHRQNQAMLAQAFELMHH